MEPDVCTMVPRARVLAPLALACLSAVAALSLARVFDSTRFVGPVLVAVFVPHAVGAFTRARGWPAVTTAVITAVLLLLFVTWRFGSDTFLGVLPSPSTLSALGHDLHLGWRALRDSGGHRIATDDGPLLLAVIVTWFVAAVGDEVAFRSRATLGAATPALVLLVFTSAVGVRRSRTEFALAFGAAAAVLLVLQSAAVLDRRRSWLITRTPARRSGLTGSALGPPLLLGLVALTMAPIVAAALPGNDARGLITDRTRSASGDTSGPAATPFVDLSRTLQRGHDREIFTVTSSRPLYWRVQVLDRLEPGGNGQWTTTGAIVSDPPDDGGGASVVTTVRQDFVIGRLSGRVLPAAYRATSVSASGVSLTPAATVQTDGSSITGMRYSVLSAVGPTESEITSAQRSSTLRAVPTELSRYLELPVDVPASVRAEATVVVEAAHAQTPYDEAEALRDYFRSSQFTYDVTVPPPVGMDAIVSFLQSKRGYCQHFASAFAVMARSLGIPTRIAVGYVPGELRAGVYHVSTLDTHAWPEVWLGGLGWTALFDPTPPSSGPGGSALPGETVSSPPTVPATTPTTVPATAPASGSATTAAARGVETVHASHWWLIPAGIALALVAVLAAYVGVVMGLKARHRARRRAVREPSLAVGSAWASALEQLTEARVPLDPSSTPLEVARRVPPAQGPALAAPLRRLARTYTVVRYGERAPGPADVEAAWSSVDEIRIVLAQDLPARERWRRRLDREMLRRTRGRSGR